MGRLQPNSRQYLDIPLANGHVFSNATTSAPLLHLTTTREESTRVQLQKQRLKEQNNHHAVVVSQRIPGFKTSAAFFASLRTNLRLNASPPPSPSSTPPSMRASTGSLPPLPSPLSSVMDSSAEHNDAAPPDPLEGVPELKTYITDNEGDKVDAMKLVADSVAQMRQAANSALIFHPLNAAVAVAILSFLARYMFNRGGRDVGTAGTTCTGAIMVMFVLCRWMTGPFITAAEEINWDWLGTADVIVTKFGDEIIGTVIVDWVSGERQKRKKAQRAEIKGWAVRIRYRKKGVGGNLLEEAVKESRKKGVETIEFAEDHANSIRVLPSFYNGTFDKNEKKAREMLQDLLEMSPARSKRRKGGST